MTSEIRLIRRVHTNAEYTYIGDAQFFTGYFYVQLLLIITAYMLTHVI